MFEAFSAPRPTKFTGHPYCDECAGANEYFQRHSIESLGALAYESEAVPLAFLTEEAFLYFMPAMARMMINGDKTGLLLLVESKRHLFNKAQRRELVEYLKQLDGQGEWMAAETLERVISELETES